MFDRLRHVWFKTPHVLLLSGALMVMGGLVYGVPRLLCPNLGKIWLEATALGAAQIITAGTVGVVLRSVTWKEAIDKALERVSLRDSVVRAGLSELLPAVDVNYSELLAVASHVDLALISARHFIASTHASRMIDFLRRGGTLNLVISDPDDRELMQHYDRCFGEDPGTRRNKTIESLEELSRLCKKPELCKAAVNVWLTRRRLTYAYHRFDDVHVITLYKNAPQSRDTSALPALVFRDGFLYHAFSGPDFDSLKMDAMQVSISALEATVAQYRSSTVAV